MKQVEKDLRRARALLEQSKLFKGELTDCKGNFCALGLGVAAVVGPERVEPDNDSTSVTFSQKEASRVLRIKQALVRAIQSARPRVFAQLGYIELLPGVIITDFNDRKQTTKKDVLEIYDEAIKAVSS